MKILMIIDGLKAGGVERRMLSLVMKLEEIEIYTIEIVVLSSTIHYTEEVKSLRSKLHIIERKPKRDPRVFFKIIRICRLFSPDIIHTWGSMPSIYSLPAKWLLKIKLVNGMIMNAPVVLPLKISIRAKISFLFSDIIVSNSMAGIESYNPPVKKTAYIPNGFDFNRIRNIENAGIIRQRLGINTKFVVGMIGRFENDKDFSSFIKAAIEISINRKDITFIAIGEGSLLQHAKNSIPARCSANILFLGKQSDVESIINIFDIGVLLSNLKVREGMSNVIIEYMALGKPVIATFGGGNNEIVDDNITGFLIVNNDINIFIERLLTLLHDPETRYSMGIHGSERIQSQFNIKRMILEYINLYQRILK